MKKFKSIILLSTLFLFIISGCSDKKYSRNEIGSISRNYSGTILAIEPVKLQGDGTGSLIGHLVGALIGYQFGKGTGRMFSTYAGSVAGMVAGNKSDYLNGLKFTIRLDNNRVVTTILKRDNKNSLIKNGDRVELLISGNRVIDIIKKRKYR